MLAFCSQPLRRGSTVCGSLIRVVSTAALVLAVGPPVSAASIDDLEAMTPTSVRLYGETPLAPIEAVAQQVEIAATQQLALPPGAAPAVLLSSIDKVLAAKARVDQLLEQSLVVRTEFAAQPDNAELRGALRSWLAITTELIDLSGRLQYLLFDASNEAVAELAFDPAHTRRLIELFAKHRSGVGALAASPLLFDAPAGEPEAPPPLPFDLKLELLGLIKDAGQVELLDELADLVRDDQSTPALRLAAAQTIEALGVPQSPRPGQDPTLPPPEITAAEMREALASLDKKTLSAAQQSELEELLARLDKQAKAGVEGDSYRLGSFNVQAGDWLLMRNPSPYNLFTELTPGLFTHVGVVAVEVGPDGQRRILFFSSSTPLYAER